MKRSVIVSTTHLLNPLPSPKFPLLYQQTKEALMTPTKIRVVVAMHERELIDRGVTARRIDPRRRLQNCSTDELLAHALYHCQHLRDPAGSKKDYSKANRQLVVIQMCLSFAGLHPIEALMDANRSD